MKVVITGKGGSGKSTIAATVARQLGRRSRSVVALDCDPNPTLGIPLGWGREELAAVRPVINALWDIGFTHDDPRPDPEELLGRYGADGPDGVRLLLAGLIEPQPGRCVCCGSHSTTRALFGELSGRGRYVIADLEAGLADLIWASPGGEDTALIVADPSANAVDIAVRAAEIARGMGVSHLVGVANRCSAAGDAERLAAALGTEVVAVPEDPELVAAAHLGVAPLDSAPDCPAVAAISAVAGRLERHSGMPD